jgi:spoIIIJ-associated protein
LSLSLREDRSIEPAGPATLSQPETQTQTQTLNSSLLPPVNKMDAVEILDTMLGYLGFVIDIQEVETENGLQLQVFTAEPDALIGPNGETLEDLQFLLNRILQAQDRDAPRVQVDVCHWRAMRDDRLRQRVRQIAETVRLTGRPVKLEPMNSYDRRIVHNTVKEDPDVMSFSPNDDARIKRITIQRRKK